MHAEMMILRNKIATTFSDLIHSPEQTNLRREFVYYVLGDIEVQRAVVTNEDLDALMLQGIPSDKMIEKYCHFIMTDRTWNGEFEAQIISRLMDRTIVILRGNSNTKMPLGTIAGISYFEQTNLDPIILRHSGIHFDCLL
jgi:hypothetical protein